jgi:DNA polymerase-3 subunit beta
VRETDDRMTIGAFARATGVTASALRFYDDCGLVTPSTVEAGSGYRYYEQRQIRTVVAIRHLRRLGLPLNDIRRLLSAPPSVIEEAVAGRLQELELHLLDARRSADRALALLQDSRETTVPGVMLAAAVGQVSSAVDAEAQGKLAVLNGVLLETSGSELRLVATDRFQLATRRLPLTGIGGSDYRVAVPGPLLRRLTGWIAAQDTVQVSVDDDRLLLSGLDDRRTVPGLGPGYPDYRQMLDALPEPTTRLIVDREHLLTGLDSDATLSWHLDPARGLTVDRAGHRSWVAGEVQGERLSIAFTPARLRAALTMSIGPDLVVDLTAPDRPVVVRSADTGDLTTVLMPVRHDLRGAA